MVKPRYGCGSISVAIAYDEEDLLYLTKKANRDIVNSYLKYESAVTEEKVIYQEFLRGQEYGADIINDLHGNTQNVIVRKKIAMRSGETDIAQLVDEPVIKNTLFQLGKLTKHIANMDCDVFLYARFDTCNSCTQPSTYRKWSAECAAGICFQTYDF